MGEPAVEKSIAPRGLSVEVLVAGGAFAASAGVTGLSALSAQHPPVALLFVGWPLFALVGAVLLDRRPGDRVARACVAVSVTPVVVVLWDFARLRSAEPAQLARSFGDLAALVGAAVAIALPWAFRPPGRAAPVIACSLGAATGGLFVVAARSGAGVVLLAAGWSLAGAATLGAAALVLYAARSADRTDRRRLAWLLIVLVVACAALGVVWVVWPGTPGYYATCGVVAIGSITVADLWTSTDFRPAQEHLLDVALLVGVVVAGAVTATLVRLGSEIANRPSPTTTMVFTALLTTAMAAPAALWVRRSVLARRYGSGLIPPTDVAAITADLHAKTEPRGLLEKAARMVAAASGSSEVRIVLGADEPAAPTHWAAHPLEVGGDRVGTLLIASVDREGPEARQQKVVAQLLPTVALVARAVGLAVEAEHARRDVARERDAERKRVMGDLHDTLGPALAGLSMRVQATLRTTDSPEYAALLTDLAEGLGVARADLRRIVAGITPSTLDDGDLEGALRGLVASFQGATDSPALRLAVDLDGPVGQEVQVAVFRSVAEGVTNALRHAAATQISVCVHRDDRLVRVEVSDDGVGGPVVPGVGLSSLARRAESLGGRMRICPGSPGTSLQLELPSVVGVSS